MEVAMTKLQQRINERFLIKYDEFVRNFILIYKDDPCVLNDIIEPIKDKYQSYDENLAKEKRPKASPITFVPQTFASRFNNPYTTHL